jgi:hypothetical protein
MSKQYLVLSLVLIMMVAGLSLGKSQTSATQINLEIKKVDIVVSTLANKQESMAANQLQTYLKAIYPTCQFSVTSIRNGNNRQIRMGLSNGLFEGEPFLKEIPMKDEGFLIRSRSEKEVILAAHSAKGLFNAVYSLLGKLGYGFYLSYEGTPLPKKELLFKEWEMVDSPLQAERVVFNWHNFLSGCTGWNYEEWCSWIDQCAKMRYNTIMVHAYGNNPMFSFEYNGIKKEVGYLTTSVSGRDWGAQHVNDVRRLPGGEIFTIPVFGSNAAQVPDQQRGESATKLMARVFKHASEMAMKINFAIDVDTWSANPQNIIESLPVDCRIKLTKQDIVNPETEQGYQYYKAQVKSLLDNYPQITTITVWMRHDRTVWRDIKVVQFPESWQNEWKQLVEKHPEIEKDKYGPSNYAISKIVVAYQKALKELKREDVSIANGSWHWDFLPTASIVMPENCTLIALDWGINFDLEETKNLLSKVGSKRKFIPVVWAHHDDHRYMGKPYTPYPDFNNLLKERNAAGFGIIHWTTRPLDLYFKSLADQVWSNTENKKLESTIAEYCQKVFGSQQQALQDYMTEWILRGPMFGRETSEHFFDLGKQTAGQNHEPTNVTLELTNKRIGILGKVNQSALSDFGKKMFAYNASMEDFYLGLFQNQEKFVNAYSMLDRKSIDSAKVILQSVTPEKTIEKYAKASSILPITSGEKAMVVSMGTRWMPDFVNLKQRVRVEDIYFKFGATQHDTLAQYPGTGTYFIDKNKILWMCLGKKELNSGVAGIFSKEEVEDLPENAHTFMKMDIPFSFPLRTIGKNNLAPGKYKLEVKYLNLVAKTSECKLFVVSKDSRIPLAIVSDRTGSKLNAISATFEIKDVDKYTLEIDPGKDGKLFTNLIITGIK